MKKVSITADLERRLRADTGELSKEIVGLLDELDKKRATGSTAKPGSGLGYRELVALFRSELGGDLILPPQANPVYIVKIVNKAREYGISKDNVPTIVAGLRRTYPRGPYSLGFVVNAADKHYAAGVGLPDTADVHQPVVYSGRAAFDSGEDD